MTPAAPATRRDVIQALQKNDTKRAARIASELGISGELPRLEHGIVRVREAIFEGSVMEALFAQREEIQARIAEVERLLYQTKVTYSEAVAAAERDDQPREKITAKFQQPIRSYGDQLRTLHLERLDVNRCIRDACPLHGARLFALLAKEVEIVAVLGVPAWVWTLRGVIKERVSMDLDWARRLAESVLPIFDSANIPISKTWT